MKKVSTVDEYIELNSHYKEPLSLLRQIINTTELEETIKWSMPTYCLNNKNILGLGAFKNHYCLWFHQGVFLKDDHNLLINAQENKTKALRQMRFKTNSDINKNIILSYIKEAIENQRLGKELTSKPSEKEIEIPKELKDALKLNVSFKESFYILTPGRQREYCEYIKDAKRESTKISRIEKIIPMIMKGIGLYDKYKNC